MLFLFLIVIEVSKLSWTRLQGSWSRKFKIPEIPSNIITIANLLPLCVVFGAYSSEPRSCLVQSFGLTLNVRGLSSTVSYCALWIQGIPFQKLWGFLPKVDGFYKWDLECLDPSRVSVTQNLARQELVSHLQYLIVKLLTPGLCRNLSQTKLGTANLWNIVHVLSTFFIEFAFSK